MLRLVNTMFMDLSPSIRGLILDMDGVLWKDSVPIGDLAGIFAAIRSRGLKVILATNNATLSVDEYLKKLAGFGVDLQPSQVITSSQAAAATLLQSFPDKGAVFVVGEEGLVDALGEAGFRPIVEPEDSSRVVAVVAGMDRKLSYDKLRRAMWHIGTGARFYGTNPDKTFPTPAGLVPGAGSILAALESASGVQPIVIGKPAPFMFRHCAERMLLEMKEILVVGDRLETDIAGGQAVGARTGLVLSGVSTPAQAELWQPRPDLVARDLASLVGV